MLEPFQQDQAWLISNVQMNWSFIILSFLAYQNLYSYSYLFFFFHLILSLLFVGHAHCTDKRDKRASVQKIIYLAQLIQLGIKVSHCEAVWCACLFELFRFQKVKPCSFWGVWGGNMRTGEKTFSAASRMNTCIYIFVLDSLIRAMTITYILNRAIHSIILRNRKSHLFNSCLQMSETKINQSIFLAD